jgi:hypothetical protein
MFVILEPCQQRTWQELPGDDRRRFCDVCGHHVYAVNRYSMGELTALREAGGGKLCGMVAPVPRRRWVVLGLLSAARMAWGETGRVRFVVRDPADVELAGARVSVRGSSGYRLQTVTDTNGQAVLTVPVGAEMEATIEFGGLGPSTIRFQATTLEEQVLPVTLRLPLVGTVIYLPRRRPWWKRLFRWGD